MIIISNGQYTIRRWKMNDAESLAKNLNNKKIWDNCRDGLPHPYTVDDAKNFIEDIIKNHSETEYCIEINSEAAGNIGFVRGIDVNRFSAEVGFWIAENYWNSGITTDALKNTIEYLFTTTDIVRIYAFVYVFNKASAHVLEKSGFAMKCIMEKAAFKNERFTDVYYFERIKH